MKKPVIYKDIKFTKIIGGGRALGELENGKKVLAWGVLPGEIADIKQIKNKSGFIEGVATNIKQSCSERVNPQDEDSYLSTSPWQILDFASEQHYKAALIEEAFEMHNIVLPNPIEVFTDNTEYGYRNKIEFSWWWDTDLNQLDLAFFRRSTKGKIPVTKTSLAPNAINQKAINVRNILRNRGTSGRDLKTLLIRCSRHGQTAAQLYVKTEDFPKFSEDEFKKSELDSLEIIYSNPKSPASIITKRLQKWGIKALQDEILNTRFNYATEGFFQINLPVYEQALLDMKSWINHDINVVDLYSGVGSIGLTIGGNNVTLVEINENAVREMQKNIKILGKNAKAILAPSEKALEYISKDSLIIVDPPRAGLHKDVIDKLISEKPKRIIYLSCNPVTQARDIAKLSEKYGIKAHRGYNFFPKTPHIEHLAILDLY
ncbi:MAG: class I SAM-dependent RNA methyltransferase [Candidatus Saccharibacteria bacterium]|jgi:uncharacterized RNA methyltransferase NEQ053